MGNKSLVLVSGKDVLKAVGGHETYVRAHALAATRLGFEPHIFCNGRRTRTTATDFGIVHHIAPPVPVVAQVPLLARAIVRFLEGGTERHLIHGFAIWSAAGALAARTLRSNGVDVATVASAYGTRAYEVGAMQKGLERHRLRYHLRYGAWLRWIHLADNPVERWGYARADVVLVNYKSVREILSRAYGCSLPIRQMPYTSVTGFLDEESRAPNTYPEPIAQLSRAHAPLVLAISRHDPRKGLDVLLIALSDLVGRGVSFRACLIGPGHLLEAHRRLAAGLGLGKWVAIPGQVDDVLPYLEQADIFVLPSLAEASGSVSIVEALRSGTAIIASACDGIPEDLAHGRDALLVAPGDVRPLTAALHTLITDAGLRQRLAAAGRQTYEQRFSADNFVAALHAVYADVGQPVRHNSVGR
jgi:glycosyltransferase involved in cell wall biosynthesis